MTFMYNAYQKTIEGNKINFKKSDSISIAGNRSGVVVQYLRTILEPLQTEPFEWHIPIESLCSVLKLNGNSLVINVKPVKNDQLLEVLNIWGHSSWGWTPILLECRELLQEVGSYDLNNFEVNSSVYEGQSVFTMLYLRGSIKDGKFIGSWNWPNASPTNSVLLWPETLEYFATKMGFEKARP